MGPADLHQLIGPLPASSDRNVLEDFRHFGDVGVYKVSGDLALVQSVDIITPVCDDPFLYGSIAAANALSDVYAAGGRPCTAMNICCFPPSGIDPAVLTRILLGGAETLARSGTALVGGHTVKDDELKYGLSVTGLVHPDSLISNAGAAAGDSLIMTKRIGTGLIISGIRKGHLSTDAFSVVAPQMLQLNETASRLMMAACAHACTDISGFGLAGHALEMAKASCVGLEIWLEAVPCFDEALAMAGSGVVTGLTAANRAATAGWTTRGPQALPKEDLLYDPQTSGGLLVAVAVSRAQRLLDGLAAAGVEAATVGRVIAAAEPALVIARGPCRF